MGSAAGAGGLQPRSKSPPRLLEQISPCSPLLGVEAVISVDRVKRAWEPGEDGDARGAREECSDLEPEAGETHGWAELRAVGTQQ